MNKLFEKVNDLRSYTVEATIIKKELEVISISFYDEIESFETVFSAANISAFNTFINFDTEKIIGYMYLKDDGFLLEDFQKCDGATYLSINHSNGVIDKLKIIWSSTLQKIEDGYLLLFAGIKTDVLLSVLES